jgi:MoaA/NifB/PqqE/SkfB family radical SAM enzyme
MDCARWWVDDGGRLYHNPADTHTNHHWPWNTLCDHLDVLTHIRSVLIVGNAGDPMSHPNIADVCEWMCRRWPNVTIVLDTNGSLGTADTFRRLRSAGDVAFRFAVDGLEHTNHIYRRRVPWHRVEHNIRQWHDIGGDATLKTIDFPWNEADRPAIKAWADSMGWTWHLDARWNPDIDQKILDQKDEAPGTWPWPLEEGRDWRKHVGQQIDRWVAKGRPMRPDCKQQGGDVLYINHDHTVWPCCYWSNSQYVQWEVQKKHIQHMQRQAEPNWNSLDHRSLEDILAHPIMRGVEKFWQGSDIDSTNSICMHQCGGCSSRD